MYGSTLKSAANGERLLVAEARAGSSIAFGKLYERHRSKIYSVAFCVLRNHPDAEDAAQRSFQHAFTNLHRFRGDSAFSTWLTRIAINEALMMLRQRRTIAPLPAGDINDDHEASAFDFADKAPTPEDISGKNELHALLVQAVSQLRPSLRIIVLRELKGLTIKQTARHLGLSVAAVGAHLPRQAPIAPAHRTEIRGGAKSVVAAQKV